MILYKCDKERKTGGKYHVFVQAPNFYQLRL